MSQNSLPNAVIVLDDDYSSGQSIENPLKQYKVGVHNFQDLEKAMIAVDQESIKTIMISSDFSEFPGTYFAHRLRMSDQIEHRSVFFILLSGKEISSNLTNLCTELGDIEIIRKPFSVVKILPFLSRAKAANARSAEIEKKRAEILDLLPEREKVLEALMAAKEDLCQTNRGMFTFLECFEQAGLIDEGLNWLESVASDISRLVYLHWSGHFHFMKQEWEKALAKYEEAQKHSRSNLVRNKELVQLYGQLGQRDQAYDLLMQTLDYPLVDKTFIYDCYDLFFTEETSDRMFKYIRSKVQAPLDLLKRFNNKGIELVKAGEFTAAIESYRKAIQASPKSQDIFRIHYNLALAAIKAKKPELYKVAEESLKSCLQLSPDHQKAKSALEWIQKRKEAKSA